MLRQLHLVTGISGWILLLSGIIMLFLMPGWLDMLWLRASIVLFIFIQLIDHFWADRLEERVEQAYFSAIKPLQYWLFAKIIMVEGIIVLMVVK